MEEALRAGVEALEKITKLESISGIKIDSLIEMMSEVYELKKED